MFVYEHAVSQKYLGFVDLKPLINFSDEYDSETMLKRGFEVEIALTPHPNLFLFCCLNSIYVMGFDGVKWQKMHVVNKVTSFSAKNIASYDLSYNKSTGSL